MTGVSRKKKIKDEVEKRGERMSIDKLSILKALERGEIIDEKEAIAILNSLGVEISGRDKIRNLVAIFSPYRYTHKYDTQLLSDTYCAYFLSVKHKRGRREIQMTYLTVGDLQEQIYDIQEYGIEVKNIALLGRIRSDDDLTLGSYFANVAERLDNAALGYYWMYYAESFKSGLKRLVIKELDKRDKNEGSR